METKDQDNQHDKVAVVVEEKKNSYRFYEVKDDDEGVEAFYVQCEWFNKSIDLDAANVENEEYCLLTITDLSDFWQLKINRDFLLAHFKSGPALNPVMRNLVLELVLQGVTLIQKQKVNWTIIPGDKIKMKLKTYYDEFLPAVAGSFFVDKVADNKKKELNRLWYQNSAITSCITAQTVEALQLRVDNIQQTCDNLQETVNEMKRETIEYKFTIFSNFAEVLNKKKDKITDMQRTIQDLSKKRSREDGEEAVEEVRCPKKVQKKSAIDTLKSIKTEETNDHSDPPPAVSSSPRYIYTQSDEDSDQELMLMNRTNPISRKRK